MSDGERPPLPDTDDPFVLLGLGDELDERELKRAYARLIKVYRPDRAPAEFARIQTAYDQLQELVRLGASRTVPQHAPAPPRAPAPPDAPEPPARPAIDPEAVAARLAELCERGAAPEILTIVEDEAHAAAAERDPELARHLLRAIATMAWYDLPWPRAMARYRELPRLGALDDAVAAADIEVAAAAALRDPAVPSPPSPLVNLLRRRRRATATERKQLVRDLARDLDRHHDAYLRAFDELERRAPAAAGALSDIMGLELPRRGEDLESLPGQVADAVWQGVQPLATPGQIAAAVTISLGLAVILLAAAGGWLGAAAAVAFVVLVFYGWRRLDALPYGPFVRRRAAGMLAAYAVPCPVLVDCLRGLEQPTFLSRYTHDLELDRGLELFGLAATLARRRRLCWRPVLTAMRDGPWPEDARDPFSE